jgi:hypothetical protein
MKRTAVNFAIVWLALVLACFARPAEGFMFYEQHEPFAPSLPQLQPQSHQTIIDLCGEWEIRVGDKAPYRSAWLPGCFDGADRITLRRDFLLHDSLRAFNFQLVVPEASYEVEVWVNGRLISSFAGDHLGFSCDIARELLRFGTPNEILLKLSSELTPYSTFPVRPQLLYPQQYGGIFSGVYLRGVPSWSIEDAGIMPNWTGDSTAITAAVRVRLAQYRFLATSHDSIQSVRLLVALRDSTGRVLCESSSDRIARARGETFQATIALPRFAASFWSPNRPVGYSLRVALMSGSDTVHTFSRWVGFKRVQLIGGDFWLNGQRTDLRGVEYVPEFDHSRRATAPSLLRRDLIKIHDLGMNVIRIPFGPPPPELLNIADELGLLVIADIGLNWVPSDVMARRSFQAMVEQSAGRLTAATHDHVCVLAWCLGSRLKWTNETTRRFSRSLFTTIHSQEDELCCVETELPQTVAGLADFVLVVWPGHRQTRSFGLGNMPVVYSQIGRSAFQGGFGGVSAGIVRQADEVVHSVREIEEDNASAGFIVHSFADYHGSSPLLIQPHASDALLYNFGIVDFERHERLAYAKLHDLVQSGQLQAENVQEPSGPLPIAFPIIGLVAIGILSIELRRNNVFRQNLKRVFLHAHGFYSDLRYRRFLHVAQPLVLWIMEAVTLALLAASALYASRSSFALDYWLSQFLPWAHAKAWVVNLVWDPARCVAVLTVIFLALALATMLSIRLFSLLFRERVDLWQSANYMIWSFAALLFLLPLAVIFYRALQEDTFSTLSIILVAAGIVWSVLRMLTALRTGFATAAWRVYGLVLGGSAAIVALILMILNSQFGTLTYLFFFHQVFLTR